MKPSEPDRRLGKLTLEQAIRSNMKTASRCRSGLCLMAMSVHESERAGRLAA